MFGRLPTEGFSENMENFDVRKFGYFPGVTLLCHCYYRCRYCCSIFIMVSSLHIARFDIMPHLLHMVSVCPSIKYLLCYSFHSSKTTIFQLIYSDVLFGKLRYHEYVCIIGLTSPIISLPLKISGMPRGESVQLAFLKFAVRCGAGSVWEFAGRVRVKIGQFFAGRCGCGSGMESAVRVRVQEERCGAVLVEKLDPRWALVCMRSISFCWRRTYHVVARNW